MRLMQLGLCGLLLLTLTLPAPSEVTPIPTEPSSPEVQAAALYRHLTSWHDVRGASPYRALTSHGPHHPMHPDNPFFFLVDGPIMIQNLMYGEIYNASDSSESTKPLLVVQPVSIQLIVDSLVIQAGFRLNRLADGRTALTINRSNRLNLPVGTYRAKFESLRPTTVGDDDEAPLPQYIWKFVISTDGERLEQVNLDEPPAPTPIPRGLQPMGIGRRF